MNVVEFFKYTNWNGDPLRHCGFENLPDLIKGFPSHIGDLDALFDYDFDILMGAGDPRDPWPKRQRARYWKPDRKNILIDFECVSGWPEWENNFNKVLHLCPHTSAWRNKILGEQKYEYVYFPISPEQIPYDISSPNKKIYDIVYAGSLRSEPMHDMLIRPMDSFFYALITNHTAGKSFRSLRSTHENITYKEKMEIFAQSKISIVHNCYWNVASLHELYMKSGTSDDHWSDNKAFSDLSGRRCPGCGHQGEHDLQPGCIPPPTGNRLLPQLKSRTFEAAAGCSLILAHKDPFKTIEHWFEEGKDFIYLEPKRYHEQVCEILENYEDYRPIAESAHRKLRDNYTTLNFYKDFILPFARSCPRITN